MIFEEQVSRKPDHYSWAGDFIEAMHNGFWTDKEFSFASDIQDFNVSLDDQEKEIIVKDEWVFERKIKNENPNWSLIETKSL